MIVPKNGERFARLQFVQRDCSNSRYGYFLCDCGKTTRTWMIDVRKGLTQSCGCLNREISAKRAATLNLRHGKADTPIYKTWVRMLMRCQNTKLAGYKNYGGRGITVCERWSTFENFYADMGECPAGMSLDRINNDKGYSPDNCRWADKRTQSRNSRNCLLTLELAKQILREPAISARDLATEYGVAESTIRAIRTGRNWPDAYEAVYGRKP